MRYTFGVDEQGALVLVKLWGSTITVNEAMDAQGLRALPGFEEIFKSKADAMAKMDAIKMLQKQAPIFSIPRGLRRAKTSFPLEVMTVSLGGDVILRLMIEEADTALVVVLYLSQGPSLEFEKVGVFTQELAYLLGKSFQDAALQLEKWLKDTK